MNILNVAKYLYAGFDVFIVGSFFRANEYYTIKTLNKDFYTP